MPVEALRIVKPTLVLDRARVLRNIERMARKAAASGVALRPHFKTHQSATIGSWFREYGTEAICVSSLDMARYFADNGWSDITLAFPVNLRQLDGIAALAADIDLGVLVDSEVTVEALAKAVPRPLNVWLKVDAGYGRVGVRWDDTERLPWLARTIAGSPGLRFAGLLTHSGHTYAARSLDEIRRIHSQSVERLGKIKSALAAQQLAPCLISIGDTPSCSIIDDFSGADEIRPGNYIFYDLMQVALGTCTENDLAVAVACPVVGKYPERQQLAIYGGAVHLGKESLPGPDGQPIFGYLAAPASGTLGGIDRQAPLVSISQEHGIVTVTERHLDRIRIGDVVHVLPVHACLTCGLFREYWTLAGEPISRLRADDR